MIRPIRKGFLISACTLGFTALSAVAGVMTTTAGATTPPNLVTNGGFEQPAIDPGTFINTPSVPGWTDTNSCGIEIQNHVAGSSYEGQQFTELDSNCSTGIYQDLTTVPGLYYTLSYAFSARPGRPASDNIIQPNWNGTNLASETADGTFLTDTSWTVYTQQVMATGSTTRLTFTDLGTSDSYGTYLDAVSVTAVQATTTGQCKDGGWKHITDNNGTPFKNQGDCVSFVATGGKNLADG